MILFLLFVILYTFVKHVKLLLYVTYEISFGKISEVSFYGSKNDGKRFKFIILARNLLDVSTMSIVRKWKVVGFLLY